MTPPPGPAFVPGPLGALGGVSGGFVGQGELFGAHEGEVRRWPQVWEVGPCTVCGRGQLSFRAPAGGGDLCQCCWARARGWPPPHDHPLGCWCGVPATRLGTWGDLVRSGLPPLPVYPPRVSGGISDAEESKPQ